MSRYVVTREIRLDLLVAELMGTTAQRAVEAVLDANPGLAAVGPVVPIGREIVVPTLPVVEPASPRRIWE